MLALIPLNGLGKGAGKRVQLGCPAEKEQLRAWQPWSFAEWPQCLHQLDFLSFPRRISQATSLGITGILGYPFQKEVILFGIMSLSGECVHAHRVVWLMFLITWKYCPHYDFFCCWKSMVRLLKQLEGVENVYSRSSTLYHLLPRCNIKVDAFSRCLKNRPTQRVDFVPKSHPCWRLL